MTSHQYVYLLQNILALLEKQIDMWTMVALVKKDETDT